CATPSCLRRASRTFGADEHLASSQRFLLPGASGALQPAPHARAVRTVNITERALKIGFLAGHYAVADDEREGHQHYQQPEIVERDGQAAQTQDHAEVNGVAREAVRSALDDGSGRQVGGDVRTGPGDSNNGPGE